MTAPSDRAASFLLENPAAALRWLTTVEQDINNGVSIGPNMLQALVGLARRALPKSAAPTTS